MHAGDKMGIAGRLAAFFQNARITPLIALLALLLGLFAVLVTPREEEPQINVTMANVLIPFPGASADSVESLVAQPAEQVLGQIDGVDHIYSVSRPGMAVITVQYKVGVPRIDALVRLYDTVNSHADWLPPGLGVGQPLIKPKGIDDVPIVTFTLHSRDNSLGSFELERIAHALEGELKRVPGTREVSTIGGPGQAINVSLQPQRLAATGLTVDDLRHALAGANFALPLGQTVDQRAITLEAGPFLQNARQVAELIVAVRNGKPVYLRDVAEVSAGAQQPSRYVWFGDAKGETPAVTISITKQPGQNAVDIADALLARVQQLHGSMLPDNVEVTLSRNYGATANDKAQKLIQKLAFATASVVALVMLALGRREAAIVGVAVILTLTATLFASWAWGFTLNRVSLFALIFSIGILVDDAIVVVENIHRHRQLHPAASLGELIPRAVDEVGGPTILATLTVIAALLPMAFVSGLMGPYMSPIPINASMGMLISLAIAFILTPWLARRWLATTHQPHHGLAAKLQPLAGKLFAPFLHPHKGGRARTLLWLAVAGMVLLSLALPVAKLVVLKMLPFDNKSELQLVVDMPAGSPLEDTAALMKDMGAWLGRQPEVVDYQAYAGVAAPINFNGLVRQYYLRSGYESGDMLINLQDKHQRSEASHRIALRYRPALSAIASRYGARIKLVEVPPGPPVMAPIVAEVYGPSAEGRAGVAQQLEALFKRSGHIVDVDSSVQPQAPKTVLLIDREKAMQRGVPQADIVTTLAAGLGGDNATWLHDNSKYPVPVQLRLPLAAQADTDALLALPVRAGNGSVLPLSELVHAVPAVVEHPRMRKDGVAVDYVLADMAGGEDSPLYGMFEMRGQLAAIKTANLQPLGEYFIHQPQDTQRQYAIKWDGEWQITYETFRDMGAAYAVGLVLIYLLVVAHFGSYLMPLIIMAPIPLTLVGVMPGHALLGAPFTATSMIGMIALAGIIVRNSILLVDFIRLEVDAGRDLASAVVHSAATRAQPIALTGLAAMTGALFILDDPIFNGLAIALIFGILVSTLLTLLVIPLLYYIAFRGLATDTPGRLEKP
ncbi:efflux RND transporter permease subunit [Vogesella facilis]|uniref:Efflux RND transporter permease subunit n=1 Tax=Vogesella facilis TaxID=1655232 RepID=A0ABV7RJM9_9NEIS